MSYITTYTRRHFDPVNPDPDLICIEDIAHALPMICRGNGHVTTFWSVGEHCICCAKEANARGLSKRLVLDCLLHDASECYMSDVPSPFKKTPEEETQIKIIDDDLLWYDLETLLDEKQETEKPKLHIDLDYTVRPFKVVEEEYLEIFKMFHVKQ